MPIDSTPRAIFAGPSVYSQQPVVHFGPGRHEVGPQACTPATLASLHEILPGLRAHAGPCGAPACFGSTDAGIGHLFEHVCIELQNLAGGEFACVRAHSLVPVAPEDAVVPYEDREVVIAAARLAATLLAGAPDAAAVAGSATAPPAHAAELAKFIASALEIVLPVQDRALVRAARARDIPVTQLVGRFLALGQGRFQQRVSATSTTQTNSIASHLAANKTYTHRVLEAAGLPMARYERVYSVRDAVAAARRIGYPVVVKPNSESMGAAVSVGMKNRRDVATAYRRARRLTKSVIIEELIAGNDYRLLVIDGKLHAAAQRVPGHVVGDGVRNVEELLAEVNRDPRRGSGHDTWLTRIALDDQAQRLLADLGYTRESIPKSGEVVYLRRNANLSDGGTSVDVTDQVHPDNRQVAERAAKAIGLDVAGVDILTTDIATSIWENDGRICEINSRPGMRSHLSPIGGKPRDVITPILDMLFPPLRPKRVPVIAVTGTGDTATTARMLAQVLAAAGRHVGLSIGRRVWSGGQRACRTRVTGPAAARMILLDPEVDVAVIECRPADILRHGLGCDAINVTAVVNAAATGTGKRTDSAAAQTIDAIRVIARSTRDVVYVADRDACIGAIERDGGAPVCRIAGASDGRQAATDPFADSRRIVLDGDELRIAEDGHERVRLQLAASSGEPDVAPSPQSALFAVLAACGLGVAISEIEQALRDFRPRRPRAQTRPRRKRQGRARASRP